MANDVKDYVQKCLTCQRMKSSNKKLARLSMPLPILPFVWHDIFVDFITGLPKFQNKTMFIVVVDRLSKSCHLGTLPTKYTAIMLTDFFVKEIIWLHGYPNSIVSDKDKVFTSKFWKELNRLCITTLNFI